MNLKDYFLMVLTGIILFGLLSDAVHFGKRGKVDTVRTVRYDTVQLPPDTIWSDTIYVPQIIYKEAPVNKGEDSVSVYSDSVVIDSLLTTHYTAKVTGRINSINFGITRKYLPQINKTITNTVTVQPDGFYVGGGVSSNVSLSLGADYLTGRHMFGISYSTEKIIN